MLRPLLSTLLISLPAFAAPTASGAPRFATDRLGCGLSAFASRYAIKAAMTGTRADSPGAFSFYDARTGAAPNTPLGTFFLRFSDGTGDRLTGARAITFTPWGWTEHREDGALIADIAVVTLEHDVFGVSVDLTGVTTPVTIDATIEGVVATSAVVSTAASSVPLTINIDNAEGRTFAAGFGTRSSSVLLSSTNGTSYQAGMTIAADADGFQAFALSFADTTAQARTLGENALLTTAANWRQNAENAWTAYKTGFLPPHTADAQHLAADDVALAVLMHNEHGPSATQLSGILPAKTHQNYFEVRDTGFAAMAAAEQSPARAIAYLDGVLRGQRLAGTHLGLVPRQVNEAGGAPSFGSSTISDDYSEMPAFSHALRAIQDRARAEVPAADLTRIFNAQISYLGWWRANRDWDQDVVPDVNGALEAGQDASPRFIDVWGSGSSVRFPVTGPTVRTPLNAADLSSALWSEYVETSRVGTALNRDEQRELLSRGSLLAAQIDEATFGHWDPSRGAYFDYFLSGVNRDRIPTSTRSAALFAPLAAGAARTLTRIPTVVGHLVAPGELWRPAGVASMAAGEAGYLPNGAWQGAAHPEHQLGALLALTRYGFETEAAELRERFLDTLASTGDMPEFVDAETGARGGAGCFAQTAAIYAHVIRNRYQGEAFAVERAGLPKLRTGEFRRLFRASDGNVVYEAAVAATGEVPLTRLSSQVQLFAGEPMEIQLTDPHAVIGAAPITLSLPVLQSAKLTWTAGPNSGRTLDLAALTPFEANAGDVISVTDVRLVGGQGCGCSSQGGTLALGGLILLALRGMFRRR